MERKAFTVQIATLDTLIASDYVGIATGNKDPEKFEKSGLHAEKSAFVDAPVLTDYPISIECTLVSYEEEHCHLFGDIQNTSVDESVLTDGKVDPAKLQAISFDIANANYLLVKEAVGKAFSDGKVLMKKV